MSSLDKYAQTLKDDPRQLQLHKLDGPLPRGWRVLRDASTNLVYFVNDETKSTSWTDPRWPLPESWIEKKDPKGMSFFINKQVQPPTPSYDDPRGPMARQLLSHTAFPIPSWIEVRVDANGYLFYADSAHQLTSWTDPRNPVAASWQHKRIKVAAPLALGADSTSSSAAASPPEEGAGAGAGGAAQGNGARPHTYLSFFQSRNDADAKSFSDPRVALPPGWLLKPDNRGVQFSNAFLKTTSFVDPRDPLPVGWSLTVEGSGLVKVFSYSSSAAGAAAGGDKAARALTDAGEEGEEDSSSSPVVLHTCRDPRVRPDMDALFADLDAGRSISLTAAAVAAAASTASSPATAGASAALTAGLGANSPPALEQGDVAAGARVIKQLLGQYSAGRVRLQSPSAAAAAAAAAVAAGASPGPAAAGSGPKQSPPALSVTVGGANGTTSTASSHRGVPVTPTLAGNRAHATPTAASAAAAAGGSARRPSVMAAAIEAASPSHAARGAVRGSLQAGNHHRASISASPSPAPSASPAPEKATVGAAAAAAAALGPPARLGRLSIMSRTPGPALLASGHNVTAGPGLGPNSPQAQSSSATAALRAEKQAQAAAAGGSPSTDTNSLAVPAAGAGGNGGALRRGSVPMARASSAAGGMVETTSHRTTQQAAAAAAAAAAIALGSQAEKSDEEGAGGEAKQQQQPDGEDGGVIALGGQHYRRSSVSGLPAGIRVINDSYSTMYEKESKLDRGAFGMVWKVTRKSDGSVYVMKEMDLSRADHEQRRVAKQEGQLHSMLNNPFIVRHENTFVTQQACWVVMEYCPSGSLWDLIAHRRSNFNSLGYWPEEQVMWWLVQLVQAVAHIHAQNIVHLDIKPANMLLAKDWSIRLCDFGLSVFTTSKKIHIKDSFAGTPAYASPEQMQGEAPDQKTDVWAVGVILYMLCTLTPPFGDLTARAGPVAGKMSTDEAHQFHALRKRILTGAYPPLPPHFGKELNTLLSKLLAKKARFRPSMDEVLKMPFVRQHIQQQSGGGGGGGAGGAGAGGSSASAAAASGGASS